MKVFKKICRKNQENLKRWLEKLLKAKYKTVVNGDGFLYAKGNCPILLTAHMDTVHQKDCTEIKTVKANGLTVMSSPQGIGGDDRCGIWIIRMILTKTKYRPSILFCEDEEIGGVGSDKFTHTEYIKELKNLKYLVELDRANDNDAVYYHCGNAEFKNYIKETIGYKEAHGSFSDISNLSPDCDIASVNLSCGYYNAHTTDEYVVFEEMLKTYKAVKLLCSKAKEVEAFEYQEERYSYSWSRNGSYYDSWYIDNWYKTNAFEFSFNKDGKTDYDYIEADSYEEALGLFFMDNPTVCYNDIIEHQMIDDVI